jgi:hypothetical protein
MMSSQIFLTQIKHKGQFERTNIIMENRILVVEDNVEDVAVRFGRLNRQGYDVHVVFDATCVERNAEDDGLLESSGFDLDKIHYGLEHVKRLAEEAEGKYQAYFFDGLRGRCFDVMNEASGRRVCLHSDNELYQKKAKQAGIPTVDPTLRALVSILEKFAGERVLH